MDILILGGTGNIGPYFVTAGVDRGHRVTVASRKAPEAGLPVGATHLALDRATDLRPLAGRDWDAVVDVAAFLPGWVRALGEALAGRVGRYVFVSSLSAVARADGTPPDEHSPPLSYRHDADPFDPGSPFEYGPMKALAEAEALAWFPGRALILRPGAIVGPGGGMVRGG